MRALILALLLPAAALAANSHPAVDIWGSGTALSFEANRGQTSDVVLYLARSANGVMFFTDSGVVISGREHATGFELVGADSGASWEPLDPTGQTTSYYIGRDPSRWVESAARYGRILRRQVYPGIDLVYYGKGNRLEYDFRAAPQADVSRVRLRFTGARAISIAADGALVVDTPEGTLRHEKPVLYETLPDGTKRRVRGEYRLLGKFEAGFRVGKHDRKLELAIDPVLDSSTYLGGSGDDSVVATYGTTVVGNTTSIDFPGAAFGRRKGSCIFVKMNGQTLIYGGTGDTVVTSASLINTGWAAVGGYTNAADLPTTTGINNPYQIQVAAWQPNYAGGATDGFLLVLYNYSGRLDSFFSYIGTPGDDKVTAIGANANFYCIVAGTTNGRGLPAVAAPSFQGVSASSAAGLDGFYLTVNSALPVAENLLTTTYFGGSGDDTPLAALVANLGNYVAGETTSPDFPVANGIPSTRNGASDAFLIRIPPFYYQPQLTTQAGILFGGSGTDRITALAALTDGTVVAGGVTSSSDLPLQNAAQAAYGGGSSDGFLAMFAPDLSATKYATYLGGSGADQVTSLATADMWSNGGIFVGGWTASQDFPVQGALQSQFGGGPDDGFIAHYDAAGNLQDSTYFGGSGSDRILGILSLGGSNLALYGQTASANLPTQNPTQAALAGPSDGFMAQISSDTIGTAATYSGKDLRSWTQFYLGNAAVAVSSTVTITSSDPSTVQLAANWSDPGQASIQIAMSSLGSGYYVDCLQDSGGATLTLAAPGYPTQTIQASCYPALGYVSYTSGFGYGNATNTATATVAAGAPTKFSFSFGVNAPNVFTTEYVQGVRPGANPIEIQIDNSNPAVGTLSTSTYVYDPNGTGITFTPVATGQTQLTFTSTAAVFATSSPLSLVVSGLRPLAASYSVPSGFQSCLNLSYLPLDTTQTLSVASADPGSLLLSVNGSQPTGSVTVSSTAVSNICLQAIGSSGDIGLTLSPPGESPITSTVHIAAPVIWFPYLSSAAQPVPLGVGQTMSFFAGIGVADPQASCCFTPNPGTNISLTITASNPQAVNIAKPTMPVTSSSSFIVTGAAPGNTTLSVQSSNGAALAPSSQNVAVAVTNKPMILPDLELGNNLASSLTVSLPFPAAAAVHLVSSNSSQVLLSTTAQGQGQAQIDLSIGSGATSATFYVYGLAASGRAQITATATGYGSVTSNVTLEPSGFGWGADSVSVTLYGPLSLPQISAFVLDPATMLPVASQSLRPGVTASIALTDANPNVVTLSSNTYSFGGVFPQLSGVSAGSSTIGITQPPGFSQPAVRQNLAVTISTPSLGFSQAPLGKNLQSQLTLSIYPLQVNQDLPLTVTSSDPSRLLISSDPAVVGSASATSNLRSGKGIYLQALSDSGPVAITATMPSFNSATLNVTLVPTGVGLTISTSGLVPNGSIFQNGQYYSTTQSPTTSLTPVVYMMSGSTPQVAGLALRAGLGPVQISVTSANTAVGTITNSPVTLSASAYQQGQTAVTFTPVGAGETDITAVQPPGFTAMAGVSTLNFNVTTPNFATNNVLMAKDTFVQTQINLANNVTTPTANVTLTITSSDPSRILLSPDAATPPSASITQTLVAGHNSSGPFYIHALANSGIVPISISAPGYTTATMNVALGDLTFQFNVYLPSTVSAILQNGPQNVYVTPGVVAPSNLPNGYSYSQVVIRPGVSIAVGIASSDPTTVSLNSSQVVFPGGASQETITYRPLQAGSATLTLSVPAGYAAPKNNGQLTINVVLAQLGLNQNGTTVGHDLQVSANLTVQGNTPPATLTVTSSDTTRLLLSPDGRSPGQGSISVTPATGGGYTPIYLQGLSDNGTATVTVSSPGYQTGSSTVTLTPSAAVFTTSLTQVNFLTTSGVQQEAVALMALDPVSLRPVATEQPIPGANLSVTVTSSDSTIVAVTTPTVTFSAANPSQSSFNISVQPEAVGTAIVSLGPLPGGATPASGGQLVINVAQPSFIVPSFTLGTNLEAPAQITLGSSVPTPGSNLSVTVSASYPFQVASSLTANGVYSLNATILAGQRSSQAFYIQATQTGTGTLSFSGGGYSSQSSGAVTQTAFVFKEASQSQPISISNGTAGTFTVLPALSPLATPVLTPLAIRGGGTPVVVSIKSSNPNVLTVITPQVTLNPGDTQAAVSVKAVSPGQAILTLSGSTYDFGTAQSSLTISVR